MAIGNFNFSKRWTDSSPETGFPTFEPDEAKVRADMQYLFDELAAYINTYITPRLNTDESQIRTAQEAIEDLVLGSIPDNSLPATKFVPGGAAGWEDITSQLTITSTDMGSNPCSLTGTVFMFSRSLGMLLVFGHADFTEEDSSDGFVGLFEVTGSFNFGYLGSVFNSHSSYADPYVNAQPLGDKLQIYVSAGDASPYNQHVPIDFSGWLLCEEAEEEES